MDTMDTIKLVIGSSRVVNGMPIDNTRPVEFTGEMIGKFSTLTGDDDTRGYNQTLYRTDDNRLVVYEEEWSKWQGETSTDTLYQVDESDLIVGGRFESLGRECGYGRPLTLDEAIEPS